MSPSSFPRDLNSAKEWIRYRLPTNWSVVQIETPDISTEITLPERDSPWWTDFRDTGHHEPLATRTLLNMVEDGDVVWDFGSKWGYFGHLASHRTNPENVHIFEANKNVCRTRLRPWNERDWDSRIHINNDRVGDGTDSTLSGDEYARENNHPDFVKMDIEGAESVALDGLAEVFAREPTLLVEIHPSKIKHTFDREAESIIDKLQDTFGDLKVSWHFREMSAEWEEFGSDWRTRSKYSQYYQVLAQPISN